jgi:hypothetical protein
MSTFEQPGSNTKTGGIMRKINLTHTGVLAVLAFTLSAGPIHAQTRTFTMPACPIRAYTVPPTKTGIRLPDQNPLGEDFTVTGTVQLTDQTSSTVFLMEYAMGSSADDTSLGYARTVKVLQHATGQLTFDKGCTRTDQYGSNNCTWKWGDSITEAYQGVALQEDIQAGKLIVDLKVNNAIPVQFSCPVCGGTCTIKLGQDENQQVFQNEQGGNIWVLLTQLSLFPLSLATPLKLIDQLLTAAAP